MDFSKTIYIKEGDYLDGRSVVIFDCDTPFQLTNNNSSAIIMHIVNTLKKSIMVSKNYSNNEQFCIMVNLTNLKKCKVSIKFVVSITTILKEVFPEKLYKCFLKNPSILFRSIYLVIRHIIDKETRDKISLLKNGKQIIYDTTF